jgi:hypothetical protein
MYEETIIAELREIRELLKILVERTEPEIQAVGQSIASLGWTRQQAARVRASLASFEEEWNAPGMELYDQV